MRQHVSKCSSDCPEQSWPFHAATGEVPEGVTVDRVWTRPQEDVFLPKQHQMVIQINNRLLYKDLFGSGIRQEEFYEEEDALRLKLKVLPAWSHH